MSFIKTPAKAGCGGGPSLSQVQVVVRSRPIFDQENAENSVLDINEPAGEIVVGLEKAFAFDGCFSGDATQESIYKSVAADLLSDFASKVDHNATILAYGPTGTGKTYTMLGGQKGEEQQGIIPRALVDLFAKADPETDSIGISFFEIFNEKVYDLLSCSNFKVPMILKEVRGSFQVPGLTLKWIENVDDAAKLLDQGQKVRAIGSTATNENSSRSHAIFRITLARTDSMTSERKVAKLSLVDLAGSESVKRTNAVGDRLMEANNINRGLLALGSCISDLCSRKPHIPFRNSTLTKVLRDCFHSNGYTTMITCVSPAEADVAETMNTLRYADRAKSMQKPAIPPHLLEIAKQASSAKKRKLAALIPPTPAKSSKFMNNTIAPSSVVTPASTKSKVRFNNTLATTPSNTNSSNTSGGSLSTSNPLLDSVSEETLSDISSLPSSSVKSQMSNISVLDASTILSPLIERKIGRMDEKFDSMNQKFECMDQKFEAMFKKYAAAMLKPSAIAAASPSLRRSPRLNKPEVADETIISGPQFSSAVRQSIRDSNENNGDKTLTEAEAEEEAGFEIKSKPLEDVTNKRRSLSRRSFHKKKVECTASPDLLASSPEENEDELKIKEMTLQFGLDENNPFLCDDFDGPTRTSSTALKPKRSVRRTTMLPPEMNRTLDASGLNLPATGRRRSVRLASATATASAGSTFKNPLEVRSNWQVFDQEKHNASVLCMINTANIAMLQKIPAIGPKTAFIIQKQRELRGGHFDSIADLESLPGVQKSFYKRFLTAHQIQF